MINPYGNVTWLNCQHVPSCSHLHGRERDNVMRAYGEGLRHLALSNYYPSKPIYPLENYFSDLPSDMISSPNAEHVKTLGYDMHLSGLGSFWESGKSSVEDPSLVGVNNSWQYAITNILSNLQYPNGGGVVLNHPKFSNLSVREVKEILDYHPNVLGIEIYNSHCAVTDRPATCWAINQWDEVLKTGRRAWGFCVQDWDTGPEVGCNVLLVDEFTEEKCLEAYRNGNFYGRLQISSDLKFSNIAYDSNAKTLTVNAENASWIEIIYGIKGKICRKRYDGVTECSCAIPMGATYIRAEAGKWGDNTHTLVDTFYNDCSDVIFSNPIMLVDSITEGKKKQNTIMWF